MRLVAVIMYEISSTRNIICILTKLNVDYKIVMPNEIPSYSPTHIILSGGDKNSNYDLPYWVINSDCPVLGISYGMNLIVDYVNGIIIRGDNLEKGAVEVTEIIDGVQRTYLRWIDDDICVLDLPEEFSITGVTKRNYVASFTDGIKWWGVKYHPEMKNYRDKKVFRRFLGQT